MKKKFILSTKVLLVLFVYLLIIFLAYSMSADGNGNSISNFVGISFIIVTFLTIISLVVMFVCEIIELIKERNKKAFLDLFIFIVLFSGSITLYDLFIHHIGTKFIAHLLFSIFLGCFIKSLNYWKRA